MTAASAPDWCVIYCRISRDRAGAGLGVSRQESDCRALAASLGLTVRHVYTDNDMSAYSGKPRPEYLRMLKDIGAAPAHVLAWHTDRLLRSPLELEDYISLVEGDGIMTYAVKAGPLDLTTPSGRMIARQLGVIARYEVEHMAERQKAAKSQAAAAGRPLGGRRPFGYAADGMSLCRGPVTMLPAEARRRGLEPAGMVATRAGPRAAVVLPYDEAAELAAAIVALASGATAHSVARNWNQRGILTSSGYRWTATEVRRVCVRPRNIALMVHRGKTIGPASWPPVTDEAVHRRMLAALADPARPPSAGPERRWLGVGIYRCACGEPMMSTTTSRGGVTRRVYRCITGRRAPGIPRAAGVHAARDASALDALVTGAVIAWLTVPGNVARLTAAPPGLGSAVTDIERIDGELDRLAGDAGREDITARQLAIASRPLIERRKGLEARIAAGSKPDVTRGSGLTGAALWGSLDLDRRRLLLSRILDVRVLPQGRGRKPGGSFFDPECVKITRKM